MGTGRNPGLLPGTAGSRRRWTNRRRDPGWGEGQMLPAWLTAWVPPTCSCLTVCPYPQKAQPPSLTPPLTGSVPPPDFQVPPGLLGPAPQNPVLQNPAPGQGGDQKRSPRTTHQRRGSARGGRRGRLVEQPGSGSPSLPKAAGASGLGPDLEGRGQFHKTVSLTFFPGGAYSVT